MGLFARLVSLLAAAALAAACHCNPYAGGVCVATRDQRVTLQRKSESAVCREHPRLCCGVGHFWCCLDGNDYSCVPIRGYKP